MHVDQAHYEHLQQAMARSTAERQEFDAAIVRDADGDADPERFATLQLDSTGSCRFLGGSGLCSVQRRYGEEALGNTCAVYPRDISAVDDRIEVTATLSCPEVARLCLLADDAMEVVPLDPGSLPRPYIVRSVACDPDDPYRKHFDLIRDRILHLLSLRSYPLASRLFFVTYMAGKTVPFFGRAASELSEPQLLGALAALDRPEVLEELHTQFARIAIPGAQALKVIQMVVLARLQVHIAYFRRLMMGALATYGNGKTATEAGAGMDTISVPLDHVWTGYQQRRDHWTARFGDRVDRMLENYSRNYWLRDWYLQSPNLLAHIQKLLVRVALLRFLLFSHPALDITAVNCTGDDDALDATAVDVFHKVVRAFEHDPSFFGRVQDALEGEGMSSVAHLIFLLKF
jgi:lysine-N-methylase